LDVVKDIMTGITDVINRNVDNIRKVGMAIANVIRPLFQDIVETFSQINPNMVANMISDFVTTIKNALKEFMIAAKWIITSLMELTKSAANMARFMPGGAWAEEYTKRSEVNMLGASEAQWNKYNALNEKQVRYAREYALELENNRQKREDIAKELKGGFFKSDQEQKQSLIDLSLQLQMSNKALKVFADRANEAAEAKKDLVNEVNNIRIAKAGDALFEYQDRLKTSTSAAREATQMFNNLNSAAEGLAAKIDNSKESMDGLTYELTKDRKPKSIIQILEATNQLQLKINKLKRDFSSGIVSEQEYAGTYTPSGQKASPEQIFKQSLLEETIKRYEKLKDAQVLVAVAAADVGNAQELAYTKLEKLKSVEAEIATLRKSRGNKTQEEINQLNAKADKLKEEILLQQTLATVSSKAID
ncbi:MAG: hypothetical protein VKL39_24775, partial [Leptolyngbyaceae bacterium]|nr:hypothetical protein [Leptolyngbyaceae bacterium]